MNFVKKYVAYRLRTYSFIKRVDRRNLDNEMQNRRNSKYKLCYNL